MRPPSEIDRRDASSRYCEERVVVHRLGEQEALAELAAEFAKRGDLLGQLDPLGDDVEAEARSRAR